VSGGQGSLFLSSKSIFRAELTLNVPKSRQVGGAVLSIMGCIFTHVEHRLWTSDSLQKVYVETLSDEDYFTPTLLMRKQMLREVTCLSSHSQ
jgi:hypothetical protein